MKHKSISHTIDEYIGLSDLQRKILFYEEILKMKTKKANENKK